MILLHPPFFFARINASSERIVMLSIAFGVGHPVNHTVLPNSALIGVLDSTPSFQSRVVGVSHEPQPLSDVRCADARSRQTDRPDGVSFSFHVILNKVEPSVPKRCFNLLTKDSDRSALADEIEPDGP